MIENELERLLQAAKKDENLKKALIESKSSQEPVENFCKIAVENGFDITAGELLACGQDMCDSMLRSVNGGGVYGLDGWDDAYEHFFTSLAT